MVTAIGIWIRQRQRFVAVTLASISILLYSLYFLHLDADFPNFSPWNDLSKITDEGWYASGAVHHAMLGHWHTAGAFNPSVAMPVWSLLAWLWLHVVGFGMVQLRVLTVLIFGVSMLLVWRLMRQQAGIAAASFAVILLVVNPFNYSFDRLAILEPVLVLWLLLTWLLARWAATSRHM
ncbi:MAG: glycosyltransferase family 39 protein, partial [Terriglobus sp.]